MGDLQGGISQKSTHSFNYRNTAVNNQGGAAVEAQGSFGPAPDITIHACYPWTCRGTNSDGKGIDARTNIGSITRGNVGQLDSRAKDHARTNLPGVHDHNYDLLSNTFQPDELFRDYKNWDFRPSAGSPL